MEKRDFLQVITGGKLDWDDDGKEMIQKDKVIVERVEVNEENKEEEKKESEILDVAK